MQKHLSKRTRTTFTRDFYQPQLKSNQKFSLKICIISSETVKYMQGPIMAQEQYTRRKSNWMNHLNGTIKQSKSILSMMHLIMEWVLFISVRKSMTMPSSGSNSVPRLIPPTKMPFLVWEALITRQAIDKKRLTGTKNV